MRFGWVTHGLLSSTKVTGDHGHLGFFITDKKVCLALVPPPLQYLKQIFECARACPLASFLSEYRELVPTMIDT